MSFHQMEKRVRFVTDSATLGQPQEVVVAESRFEDAKEIASWVGRNGGCNPYTGIALRDDATALDWLAKQVVRTEHDALSAGSKRAIASVAKDDGSAGYFTQSELARVEATMLDKYYKPMQYSRLVPTTVGTGVAYDSIRYQLRDRTGQALELSKGSDTLPTAEVSNGVKDITVTDMVGIAYKWNVLELAQSAFLRRPLDAQRAMAAREAFERTMNQIALFGSQRLTDKVLQYPSLLNARIDSALTKASIQSPITGAWGGVTSTSTTAVQIVADINTLLTYVWTQTGYNEWPDRVLLPTTCMTPFTQIISSAGNRSLLDYLKENNVVTVATGVAPEFIFTPGLEDTSQFDSSTASGNRRVVAYQNSPDAVEFEITQGLTFLAPQYEGLKISVPGYGRCTRGIKVKRPTNIAWMDGV